MALRITGGRLSRRRLEVPSGDGVRPTSDRVRESLFSMLGARWEEARVLDLFAGSGALGVESLSRGAAEVVFVERDARTLGVLRRNLATLELTSSARVLRTEARRALRKLREQGARFDAVFLDPPYATTLLEECLEGLADGALLRDNALVVCEHPTRTPPLDRHGVLHATERRKYGDTTVTLYERTP